jgi:polyhydroxybutyrate depolymerase
MKNSLLVIALFLAACGCSGTSATDAARPSSGCGRDSLEPGTHAFTFDYDGRERTYTVHIPVIYDDENPAPLLLNLHPLVLGGQLHDIWTNESQQDVKSEDAGFIVLQPDGIGDLASWNAGDRCCSPANDEGVDDVGFIHELVRHTQATLCIDERRVYATGMSNGGYLSHRIACEFPGRLAAIAPVVGSLSQELVCADGRGVPVLQLSGAEDSLASRQQSVDSWVAVNKCSDSTSITHQVGGVTCMTHDECKDGVVVTHCVVEGGGHCSYSDAASQLSPGCAVRDDITSQDLIWDFFSNWRLP